MSTQNSAINRRLFNLSVGATLVGSAGGVLAQAAKGAKPLAGQTVKLMYMDALSG